MRGIFNSLILILLSSPAWAGVNLSFDEAMTSEEMSEAYYAKFKFPEFKSKSEAVEWARNLQATKDELKGYRRSLNRKMLSIGDVAYTYSHLHTPDSYQRAGELMQEAYFYELARNEVELRERAVGSVFYAGSEPI